MTAQEFILLNYQSYKQLEYKPNEILSILKEIYQTLKIEFVEKQSLHKMKIEHYDYESEKQYTLEF